MSKTMTAILIALFLAVPMAGSAAFEIPGLIRADGYEYLEASQEKVVLRGGSPVVVWTEQRTKQSVTVRSPEITVLWVKAAGGQTSGVDRVILKGDRSRIEAPDRGMSIEASEITVVAPRTKTDGIIDSAFAKGNVRYVQSQGGVTGDATSEALEVKDGGDTAVLSGNVVINFRNPQYTGRLTGEVATITNILPKGGQPSNPRIVVTGDPSRLSASPAGGGK